MKKAFLSLTILFLLFNSVSIAFAEPINIDARSYILIDSKTGQVLYQQNADEKSFPASTTKMMTAIIAIEKGNIDQVMTASRSAVDDIGKDGMNIGIMPGEEIRLENLLNALLISSANETANIIAENICPTRKEFVDLMNAKAKELGAVDTHFANPCGSHDPNHYTTARDLAIIARYAMTLPKFREIVSKKDFIMPPTNKHASWPVLATTNKLMYQKSNYFTNVIGIKTGYTGEAGYNLVSSAANSDGMELISVVMDATTKSGTNMVFNDSKSLLEYGFKNYSLQKIAGPNEPVQSVQVQDANNDAKLDLVTSGELSCVLPDDKNNWNISKNEQINASIAAPVQQGEVLGYIEYERDGIKLGKVDVIASRTVEANPKSKLISSAKSTANNPLMKKVLIGVVVIFLSFMALRFILRVLSRSLNTRRMRN